MVSGRWGDVPSFNHHTCQSEMPCGSPLFGCFALKTEWRKKNPLEVDLRFNKNYADTCMIKIGGPTLKTILPLSKQIWKQNQSE